MKRRCLLIAICLLFTPFFVGESIAWEFTIKSPKMEMMQTTDAGVVFKLKFKKDLTPMSLCKNEFILPNTHAEYNLLAALLMTASAQKKKVDVEFDETLIDCQVEIRSIVMY